MKDSKAPKFSYGRHVWIIPLSRMPARIIDIHFCGMTGECEYDVRYFHNGLAEKIRVFEDELESN